MIFKKKIMFEFLKPKGTGEKAPDVKTPTLEELKAALPTEPKNLRDEFQKLSEIIEAARIKGEARNEVEVEDEETMSPRDIEAYDRYGVLYKIAKDNLEKKS